MDSHVLGLQLYCFESEFSDSELLNSESDDSGDCGNTLIDLGAQTVDMFKFTDPIIIINVVKSEGPEVTFPFAMIYEDRPIIYH